jgi:hypothetical protein
MFAFSNVARTRIPNLYNFIGKIMCKNYIQHCENGGTMGMWSKAWMTNRLFPKHCLAYFVKFVSNNIDEIYLSNQHLLKFDGNGSYVTLEIV